MNTNLINFKLWNQTHFVHKLITNNLTAKIKKIRAFQILKRECIIFNNDKYLLYIIVILKR